MKCITCILISTGFSLKVDPVSFSKQKPQVLIQTTFATEEQNARVRANPDPLEGGVIIHQKEAGGGYQEGSPLYAKQQEKASKGKKDKANYAEADKLPISTTVKCILNLLIQYFILCTALAFVETYNKFQNVENSRFREIIKVLIMSVNYAPMLCVLFLGTRMRAIQLTQGNTELYKLPQPWAQNSMQIASWSVLGTALVGLLTEVAAGSQEPAADGTKPKKDSAIMSILSVCKFICMAGLYLGFIIVVIGAIAMPAPEAIWKGNKPPVSPAVANTINLCTQYFIVVLMFEIYTTKVHMAKSQGRVVDESDARWENMWRLAAETVAMAPMLCVMFIAVRQRALAEDPKNGNPQSWAQNCMFLCSYSVLAQTILVIIIPLIGGKVSRARDAVEGDINYKLNNPTVQTLLEIIRWLLMLTLYISFIIVAVSPFILEGKGGGPAKPIAPALANVLILVAQYFITFLLLWVSIIYSNQGGSNVPKEIFNKGKQAVHMAPMLAILYIATRMRSDQIGLLIAKPSAPPRYGQEGMHLCTWALFLQVVLVIIDGIINGNAERDADGKVMNRSASVGSKIIDAFRYLFMLALYGGIIVILYTIFFMDAASVDLENRRPGLIPGVEIPAPGAIAQGEKIKFF